MSCEDDLARAQTTLQNMQGYLKVAVSERQSLEREYIRLSILVNGRGNVGSGTGGREGTASGAGVGGPGVGGAAIGETREVTETRPAASMSPAGALQKKAGDLSQRLAQLEARV